MCRHRQAVGIDIGSTETYSPNGGKETGKKIIYNHQMHLLEFARNGIIGLKPKVHRGPLSFPSIALSHSWFFGTCCFFFGALFNLAGCFGMFFLRHFVIFGIFFFDI
jgi:hypothetical protein